jgi:hypothetical protein
MFINHNGLTHAVRFPGKEKLKIVTRSRISVTKPQSRAPDAICIPPSNTVLYLCGHLIARSFNQRINRQRNKGTKYMEVIPGQIYLDKDKRRPNRRLRIERVNGDEVECSIATGDQSDFGSRLTRISVNRLSRYQLIGGDGASQTATPTATPTESQAANHERVAEEYASAASR